MWTALLGAIAAALLGGDDPRSARRRRSALGLFVEDGDPQLELGLRAPGFSISSDWLVPVQIWEDGGGLWRVIGQKGLDAVEADLPVEKGKNGEILHWNRRSILSEIDPANWDPTNVSIGRSDEVYVYVEGPRFGGRPSVLAHVNFEYADTGQLSVAKGVPPNGSLAHLRLLQFAAEAGWNTHTASKIWPKVALVTRPEALEALHRAGSFPHAEVEAYEKELLASPDWDVRQVGVWLGRWMVLEESFSLVRSLVEDRDRWDSAQPDDDEILDEIRESNEEAAEEILAEMSAEQEDGVHSRTFDHIRRSRIEELNSDLTAEYVSLLESADDEASAASDLLDGNFVEKNVTHKKRAWDLKRDGDSRYDEPLATIELTQDIDGSFLYDLDRFMSRSVKESPRCPGVLRTLWAAGFVETAEERAKRAGAVAWEFPGLYQAEWELWALMGVYQPKGNEPTLLFLKISADHGLLEEPVRLAWEKLLLALQDPIPFMAEHGLVR